MYILHVVCTERSYRFGVSLDIMGVFGSICAKQLFNIELDSYASKCKRLLKVHKNIIICRFVDQFIFVQSLYLSQHLFA